jgi:hypothetical protein
MVETFKVIVAAGSTLGGHDAMRHTVAEVHPHIVTPSLLAVDSETGCHRHKDLCSKQTQPQEQQQSLSPSLFVDRSFSLEN